MEWDADAKKLCDEVVNHIPKIVKPIAVPAIRNGAQKAALNSGHSVVSQSDVVEGIFKTIPQTYRARIVANLSSLGISCHKYLHPTPTTPEIATTNTSLKELMNTLIYLSKQSNVPFNTPKTKTLLQGYGEFFSSSPLSICATVKPKNHPALTIRYIETAKPHVPDPFTMGILADFVEDQQSSIRRLFEELKTQFDILGYGVEVDVEKGLSRILMVPAPISMEAVLNLKHLPNGAKKYSTLFNKNGFTHISIFGFDLVRQTVGLHVLKKNPSAGTSAQIDDFIRHLHYQSVPVPVIQQCAQATIVYPTFSWRRDSMERISFVTLYTEDMGELTALDPQITSWTENPTFSNGHNQFMLRTSIAPAQYTLRIETDYKGYLIKEIQKAAKAGI